MWRFTSQQRLAELPCASSLAEGHALGRPVRCSNEALQVLESPLIRRPPATGARSARTAVSTADTIRHTVSAAGKRPEDVSICLERALREQDLAAYLAVIRGPDYQRSEFSSKSRHQRQRGQLLERQHTRFLHLAVTHRDMIAALSLLEALPTHTKLWSFLLKETAAVGDVSQLQKVVQVNTNRVPASLPAVT